MSSQSHTQARPSAHPRPDSHSDPSSNLGARSAAHAIGRWAPLVLVIASALAYANSFAGPFVFDDIPSILYDPRVRTLWPLWHLFVYSGEMDFGTVGRPIGTLSIALNHALSGFEVWSYHAFNLLVHAAAGLALYGIVRRTLRLERFGARFARSAEGLALAVALLWLVHPLHTKSVTFVIQRLESLMGLCYLATLYCAIRGSTRAHPGPWFKLAVLACALGMATKEVMASAPLVVLLYDRTFLAGSLRAALRARASLYIGLAATWMVLLVLMLSGTRLGASAHEAATAVTPLAYLKTQSWALVHYLGLSVWPARLVFDYGTAGTGVPIRAALAEYLPWACAIGALLAATLVGTWKRTAWGFLGAVFFLVLLPSSSFVPLPGDVVAEHRMYLPLAALITALVLGGQRLLERAPRGALVGCIAVACAALALGARTHVRNRDYASALALWADTVAKRPQNERARTNYGLALEAAGELEAALAQHQEALRINPRYAQAHHNLAVALTRAGRLDEAAAAYRATLEHSPNAFETHLNLADVLVRQDELDDALAHYREVVRLRPDVARAHVQSGTILYGRGQLEEALAHYARAQALEPADVQLMNQIGITLAQLGRWEQAAAQFQRALVLAPGHPDASANLQRVIAEVNAARAPR